ncbi:2-C-methyl-D-erythritol 4-phosphate cytidylyltransferase [Aneurinibacillus soli]|uniref:2-C-methyl-D-erythritol 4-phosphate cytidylyltransferase n=1 Tax=Aneurinibacillus soli TaxID=1500254 RepID=A0A0U5AVC2_9BACL|nr:2-C-methyl-D-erythritol 4-phosphate cytidylyltransferase [Aneurinibacillus soli]PYE57672.1 2-C-methyl-D-erythritol 4-phosphate cytidylyltransferase [Aneurinibacillus soli]BAU26146.1 2-C-methyl-D-erythritol 4-phosphate cytidylyltransferase [Aneurinibacillus soli]
MVGVVIAAAGQGKRMGGSIKKQFIELEGKPVLLHTLDLFASRTDIADVVVVTSAEDVAQTRELIASYPVVRVVAGGAERQDSVYEGLCALRACEYVLIHDGARPFVSQAALDAVIQAVRERGPAILAVPVKDTIKRADEAGQVLDTPPRKSLWAVQTPQAFLLSTILTAHEKARSEGFVGTDDASLVERVGQAVYVVEGEYTNIKLTTPDDLIMGEAILRQRKEKES